MNKFFTIIICIIVGLMVTGCFSPNTDQIEIDQTKKDELILSIGGEPDDGFDPTTGWGRYGSPLFQSTLLKRDKEFNIEYDLATGYEVSDDGLVWTIELRDDVTFRMASR